MPNILDFSDLENTVNIIIDRANKKNPTFGIYLLTLKNFGFRPVEALEKSRFISYNSEHFVFTPSKKNNTRILPILDLPTEMFYYYFSNSEFIQQWYYKRFQRNLKEISPAYNYTVDGKKLGLYIFRYYYVRKLYMDGLNFEQITSIMGWKNQFLAFKYVTRNIIVS